MDLLIFQQAIFLEIKSNQVHLWENKYKKKLAKGNWFQVIWWLKSSSKKSKETITEVATCSTVFQEVNKTWMFGKRSWPNGLTLKPSFTSIVMKSN